MLAIICIAILHTANCLALHFSNFPFATRFHPDAMGWHLRVTPTNHLHDHHHAH